MVGRREARLGMEQESSETQPGNSGPFSEGLQEALREWFKEQFGCYPEECVIVDDSDAV